MKRMCSRFCRVTWMEHDRGFSLIEALIAMVVFGTAMSVMASVVMAMTNNTRQGQGVSVATDQTRLAFQRLDKQVRYANGLSTPGTATDGSGWYVEFRVPDSMRDNRTTAVARDHRCHQWRVLARKLQTRTWLVNSVGVATPPKPRWTTVGTGIDNEITTDPPFLTPIVSTSLHRQLAVDLVTKRSDRPVGRAQVKAAFFARNTTLTSPVDVCQQVGRS